MADRGPVGCVHHEVEWEAITEPVANRIAYILSSKSREEQVCRLDNMRPMSAGALAVVPQALKLYDETRAQAWKLYDETRAQAWKLYDETRAPAWKLYDETTDQVLKLYDETTAQAWKLYEETRAPAW